jgi:hypothetical protein
LALDFSILDSDGTPSESLALGVDEHWELITVGRRAGSRVTESFADYYADALLDLDQLVAARSQLRELQEMQISSELAGFLVRLDHLIARAIDSNQPVHILAD